MQGLTRLAHSVYLGEALPHSEDSLACEISNTNYFFSIMKGEWGRRGTIIAYKARGKETTRKTKT
jgi:hypothetical protein